MRRHDEESSPGFLGSEIDVAEDYVARGVVSSNWGLDIVVSFCARWGEKSENQENRREEREGMRNVLGERQNGFRRTFISSGVPSLNMASAEAIVPPLSSFELNISSHSCRRND